MPGPTPEVSSEQVAIELEVTPKQSYDDSFDEGGYVNKPEVEEDKAPKTDLETDRWILALSWSAIHVLSCRKVSSQDSDKKNETSSHSHQAVTPVPKEANDDDVDTVDSAASWNGLVAGAEMPPSGRNSPLAKKRADSEPVPLRQPYIQVDGYQAVYPERLSMTVDPVYTHLVTLSSRMQYSAVLVPFLGFVGLACLLTTVVLQTHFEYTHNYDAENFCVRPSDTTEWWYRLSIGLGVSAGVLNQIVVFVCNWKRVGGRGVWNCFLYSQRSNYFTTVLGLFVQVMSLIYYVFVPGARLYYVVQVMFTVILCKAFLPITDIYMLLYPKTKQYYNMYPLMICICILCLKWAIQIAGECYPKDSLWSVVLRQMFYKTWSLLLIETSRLCLGHMHLDPTKGWYPVHTEFNEKYVCSTVIQDHPEVLEDDTPLVVVCSPHHMSLLRESDVDPIDRAIGQVFPIKPRKVVAPLWIMGVAGVVFFLLECVITTVYGADLYNKYDDTRKCVDQEEENGYSEDTLWVPAIYLSKTTYALPPLAFACLFYTLSHFLVNLRDAGSVVLFCMRRNPYFSLVNILNLILHICILFVGRPWVEFIFPSAITFVFLVLFPLGDLVLLWGKRGLFLSVFGACLPTLAVSLRNFITELVACPVGDSLPSRAIGFAASGMLMLVLIEGVIWIVNHMTSWSTPRIPKFTKERQCYNAIRETTVS